MTYYSDNRITYQTAEEAIEEYVREHSDTRHLVSAREICLAMDIEVRKHNCIRVYEALSERFERNELWSNQEHKFVLEANDG